MTKLENHKEYNDVSVTLHQRRSVIHRVIL